MFEIRLIQSNYPLRSFIQITSIERYRYLRIGRLAITVKE
jgi:hypothetical protein